MHTPSVETLLPIQPPRLRHTLGRQPSKDAESSELPEGADARILKGLDSQVGLAPPLKLGLGWHVGIPLGLRAHPRLELYARQQRAIQDRRIRPIACATKVARQARSDRFDLVLVRIDASG